MPQPFLWIAFPGRYRIRGSGPWSLGSVGRRGRCLRFGGGRGTLCTCERVVLSQVALRFKWIRRRCFGSVVRLLRGTAAFGERFRASYCGALLFWLCSQTTHSSCLGWRFRWWRCILRRRCRYHGRRGKRRRLFFARLCKRLVRLGRRCRRLREVSLEMSRSTRRRSRRRARLIFQCGRILLLFGACFGLRPGRRRCSSGWRGHGQGLGGWNTLPLRELIRRRLMFVVPYGHDGERYAQHHHCSDRQWHAPVCRERRAGAPRARTDRASRLSTNRIVDQGCRLLGGRVAIACTQLARCGEDALEIVLLSGSAAHR